ncbi:MAG: hypothetical protein L0Y44_12020 [Phycisphaerales bacterium]|nr:hypothetical protein [Phycisphaerales bacterium]MCI0631366.1 hypothetical protein [Phycisphaerales bacterium]MCI0675511.1 hypothetical protein [Phycisphaerales bacterium]
MKHKTICGIAAITATLCVGSNSSATSGTVVGNQPTTFYRLDDTTTFQQGCFDPCLCPIMNEVPVRGVFGLTLVHTDMWFATYAVSDVNWAITFGDTETNVRGSGRYTIGGDFAYMQRLQLALQIGDEPSQVFDSGWQPVSGFPAINLDVSINGMFCYDKVFYIDSQPVDPDEIINLTLQRDSTYQQGCFDPCDCVLWEEQPMTGTFALVPVALYGTYREYAVVGVQWAVAGGPLPLEHNITGYGTYIQIDGFAGTLDFLDLVLKIDGGPPTDFHGGNSLVTVTFPEIDVVVSMNDMVCYDVVLHVHADHAHPPFVGPSK